MNTAYDLDVSAPATLALQESYARHSNEVSTVPSARLDISYGTHPRQKLDIFAAGRDAPAIVFFHGGYWRMGSKDSRRFPAPAWNRRGVAWVAVNCRLLPANTLADAVSDARAAVRWLADHAAPYGIDTGRLHITGNSAGAHLAAMVAATDWGNESQRPAIASLAVVSGLFDLAPLMSTAANQWLRLTPELANAMSPAFRLPSPDLPVLVAWGGGETKAFSGQSQSFAELCRANGNSVAVSRSPDADHFQIIGEYGAPGSPLFEQLSRLVKR